MKKEADTESEMIKRLAFSPDSIFQRAEELNASFERSPKPRQRKVVEILHKHGIPACVGPFFDTYENPTRMDASMVNRMATPVRSYGPRQYPGASCWCPG